MSIELLLPATSGASSPFRSAYAYDRFAAELGAALGDDVVIREQAIRALAPEGVALVHAVGDMAPLAQGAETARFGSTIFLGARTSDIPKLVAAFKPAGIIETSALADWRQGRVISPENSGIHLRRDVSALMDVEQRQSHLEYALAPSTGISLVTYLGRCLRLMLDQAS